MTNRRRSSSSHRVLLVAAALLVPAGALASYVVHEYGDISSGGAGSWEVTAAALPPDVADRVCTARPRNPGDPHYFFSWAASTWNTAGTGYWDPTNLVTRYWDGAGYASQHIFFPACSPLELDTRTCNGDAAVRTPGFQYGGPANDNISLRLADDRIVQFFGLVKQRWVATPAQSTCYAGTAMSGQNRDQISLMFRATSDCGATFDERIVDGRQITDLAGALLSPTYSNFDRWEAYADPWTLHVLITAQGAWDVEGKDVQCGYPDDADSRMTAFLDVDASGPADAWSVQRLFDANGLTTTARVGTAPTSITSVPLVGGLGGSRVYWFNCDAGRPTLYVADNPWILPAGARPEVIRLDEALAAAFNGTRDEYRCDWTHDIRNIIAPNAVARLTTNGLPWPAGSDTIRVMYPQKVTVGFGLPGGSVDHDYGTYRVADFDLTTELRLGGFRTTARLRNELLLDASSATPRASIYYPNLIQVDAPTARDPQASAHLLQWYELQDGWQDPAVTVTTLVHRFRAWLPPATPDDPNAGWLPPRDLGVPVPCATDCSPGDYVYGAYVDAPDACTRRFLVPWGQPGWRTHAALVTASADEDYPVLSPEPLSTTYECLAQVPAAPAVSASDACAPSPPVSFVETREPGSCVDDVVIDRSWSAQDHSGHETVHHQSIRVWDRRAPRLPSAPATVFASCDAVPPLARSATDNCDPSPVVTAREERIDGACSSGYTLKRTWLATDRCGNHAEASQTVIVADVRPPTVTPSPADVHCVWPIDRAFVCFSRSDFHPAVADDCSASPTWRFASCSSSQPSSPGVTGPECYVADAGETVCVRADRTPWLKADRRYSIAISASDDCGNWSSPVTVGTVTVPFVKPPDGVCRH